MTTSTFDKIYANAQNMNIETSEWFNRAGFFWCQCTGEAAAEDAGCFSGRRAARPSCGMTVSGSS